VTQEELQAIQRGNVDEVQAAIESIVDPADLAALGELEAADGSPRKGVTDALDKRAAALADADEKPAPPAKAPAAQAKVAAPAAPAAPWKARDYSGPLTGDQAAWRNANLKPAAEPRKK